MHMIHMDPEAFKPYSLRRGGATHHYVHVGRISDTQHRGRWNSYAACRIYVVEGQRELNESALSYATKRACALYSLPLRQLL